MSARRELAALRERMDAQDAKLAALFAAMREAAAAVGIHVPDDDDTAPLTLIPGGLARRLDGMERGLIEAMNHADMQAAAWTAWRQAEGRIPASQSVPAGPRDRHGLHSVGGGAA